MEKCEVNENNIKKLDERVSKLEQYREKDKEQIFRLDKSLTGFITEMKHISNDLKTIVSNFKEVNEKSIIVQENELAHLKEKVDNQDKQIKALSSKLELETTGKDAKRWNDTIKYIFTAILGLVIGYIFFQLGLKK